MGTVRWCRRCRCLRDRRIPGSKANIDHVVRAPRGVFVIDAKRYGRAFAASREHQDRERGDSNRGTARGLADRQLMKSSTLDDNFWPPLAARFRRI
ncbi:MAG: nuclease-related domain-containing protein [Pseudolysinimonas sp.]